MRRLLPLLAACHGDPAHFDLEIDEDPLEIRLTRDGEPLLVLPADGLQLGQVDALDDSRSYDPVYLDPVPFWATVTQADATDAGLELTFTGDATATLSIDAFEGRWALHLVPTSGPPVVDVRLRARIDPDEGLYGLGEVFDTPNHRGHARAMQIELDLSIESANNERHVPVPLLIGTTGWGLFVADRHPGLFEVATEADDLVQVTFGVGMDGADGLRFHLLAADHPLDVTGRYYEATTHPALPAPWALGPLVWRDENRDQAEVEADLNTLRDLDLATSGLWIDRPYASGVNSFDFRPDQFPEPQAMIDLAHDLGFRVGLWHTPYVSATEVPTLHDEAVSGGFFPPGAPAAFAWSLPIDFTNPEAYAWWQGLIDRYTAMGIEGYKLDYAEEVLHGANGGRLRWSFDNGADERTMASLYPMLYHRVYAETLPDDGGFLLCRAGTWGDQANARIIWPGDIDATLTHFGQVAVDRNGESYVSVGGVSSAVVAGSSLGPSGFPFFGSDTGGYRHAPPSKETYIRWFEHTALSTVMQVGTNSNDLPWDGGPDDAPFDAEVLDLYRDYARLHLRLWPYLWTHAHRLATTGRAIQRPLGLAHPELGVHPPHDYLLGDDLLVAPVVEPGATARAITLPAGRWIHWLTGQILDGGDHVVDAPLGTLPVFLRQGGIVPLLRPTIDTLAPTTAPDRVDSYATTPGRLWARVFPGAAGSFTLWDGATIEVEGTDTLTLTTADGDVFDLGFVIELLATEARSVAIDGVPATEAEPDADEPVAGTFAVTDGLTRIGLPPGRHTVTLELP